MSKPYMGGCACGAIRYQISGEPVFMNDCQCRDCQRRSGTGQRQDRDHHDKAAGEHGQRQGNIVGGRIPVESPESAAVVARRRRERVEDLAQPVRPRVVDVRGRRARRIPVAARREWRGFAEYQK